MILIAVVVFTFLFMEAVAWFMHKYIMHGFAWRWHKDHHKKENHDSFFEYNDLFFIFFAVLSVLAFGFWSYSESLVALGLGLGISIYGLVYTFVHEIFIHQRIKIWSKTKNSYLLAIRRAHKIHHRKLDKHDGECFGMLWVPLKYFNSKN